MSDTPIRIEVNCETGVETIIPLTPEEIEQARLADVERKERLAREEAEAIAAAEAKASAQAKLAALGLTADEIAALTK